MQCKIPALYLVDHIEMELMVGTIPKLIVGSLWIEPKNQTRGIME